MRSELSCLTIRLNTAGPGLVSQITQQETAEAREVSSRRATKRGRPKSERKKLDGELFKRLKADSSAEVDRHDFQQNGPFPSTAT